MAQRHMDRLSSFDTSFLANEKDNAHMAIGAVLVFDGPAPTEAEFLAQIRSRLHLLPRLRQRLLTPPLGLGTPFWVDDDTFDVRRHVGHATLTAPGTDEELRALAGELYAPALDRRKPLWELTLVDGFAAERFAVDLQDPPRDGRRHLRRRHRDAALRRRARGAAARHRAAVAPASLTDQRRPRGPRRHRRPRHAASLPALAERRRPRSRRRLAPRRRRPRRALGGDLEPLPPGAAGADQPARRRPAPRARLGDLRPRRVQADQERPRRHRQRRLAGRRRRRPPRLVRRSRPFLL